MAASASPSPPPEPTGFGRSRRCCRGHRILTDPPPQPRIIIPGPKPHQPTLPIDQPPGKPKRLPPRPPLGHHLTKSVVAEGLHHVTPRRPLGPHHHPHAAQPVGDHLVHRPVAHAADGAWDVGHRAVEVELVEGHRRGDVYSSLAGESSVASDWSSKRPGCSTICTSVRMSHLPLRLRGPVVAHPTR